MQAVLKELRPTLTLALPIVVGQASQMLMGITDSVMIGRVGVVPLAAASFTTAVFTVFYIVGIGLLLPVAVLVARAHGAKQPDECGRYLRHGMWVGTGTGLAGAALLLVVSARLDLFGQPAEVVAAVGPYFRIIAVSLVPVLMYQVLRQYSEALGHPWSPMVVLLLGVALNAFLNWALIWGHLGFPALGLEGAGWATLVARIAAVAALWLWLHRLRDLRATWPERWRGPLERRRLREMFSLGVPAAGQLLFEGGAFAAAALMMGWLGTVPLAAHQIAINCASFTFMFPLGLALATSIRIGRTVGEGRRAALRPIGFGAIGAGVAFMACAAIVFTLGGAGLARGFTPDAAVVALATRLFVVAAIFQAADGAQVIGAAALRGLTDVKVPTAITFVAYWVIALPGGFLLAFRSPLGPLGVWTGLAGGLATAAVFLAWRFHRKTAEAGAAPSVVR